MLILLVLQHPQVRGNLARWFPREEEYQEYIHWDENDPAKYTRNLIFNNKDMDVLLLCWPPGAKSAIHSHDDSSCWVALVEGEVCACVCVFVCACVWV